MASRALPVLPCLDAMDPERPPPALVSDVLEEIFLRVASPADLARAAAACVSFRGLISSPSFLRRYRSVHPPLLLGFVNRDGFHPVEATHPSAAVSHGLARTVDLSFLPHGAQGWCVSDVRGGRVLVGRKYCRLPEKLDMGMERGRGFPYSWDLAKYWDVAVCDPLFQRYLPLPPISDDLFASVGLDNKKMYYSGASLIPSGGTEEETSFSVICWMFSETRMVVLIFSSTSPAHWAAVKSISWADLDLSVVVEDNRRLPSYSGQCAYGCFYWKVEYRRGRNKLIKLDMDTMEFSKYDLPRGNQRSIAIVESGEGKVAMFSTIGEGPVECYTYMQSGTKKSHKWHLKSTVSLPVRGPSNCFIAGQSEGYVFLAHITEEQDLEYFSLEVKSYNIERACRTSSRITSSPYFGFPPFMSPRRIQGGHGESAWRLNGTVDRAV